MIKWAELPLLAPWLVLTQPAHGFALAKPSRKWEDGLLDVPSTAFSANFPGAMAQQATSAELSSASSLVSAPQLRRPVRFRFIYAYATTLRVIWSYLWLRWWARLRSNEEWYAQAMEAAHRRNARRVEHAIIGLQGLFIKVGQLLSSMSNFLPEAFRSELAGLQDQVPPQPLSHIEGRVAQELGKPPGEIFATFKAEPIAAASLGQVHEATLQDGTRVVVKVQHPQIEAISHSDLRTIKRILQLVGTVFSLRNVHAYHDQIKELIERELDFRREAHYLQTIADNFQDEPEVRFPRVIEELSTGRVMTQTFVEGAKITDSAFLERHKIDRARLARRLLRAYCQMVFVDGIYHADPHPGNLLVSRRGELIFLDFGAVAEVPVAMREGMPEFLEGVLRRDTERLLAALEKMGFLAKGQDPEVAEQVIDYFHRRFQEEVKLESFNLRDIKINPQRGLQNLLDLRRMNLSLKEISAAFHIPRHWVLLQRTSLLLTGVCTELDPELNPLEVVQPYVEQFVLGNQDWTEMVVQAIKDMALQGVTLPGDIRHYLKLVEKGRVAVAVRGLDQQARLVYLGFRQGIYALLAVCAWGATAHYYDLGNQWLALRLGYLSAGMSVWLCGSLLFSSRRFSEKRPRR